MPIKIKTVNVKIQSEDEFKEGLRKQLSQIDRGILPKKAVTQTSFSSIDALKKVFTEKRLELMHCIRKKKPKSIYELAMLLNRDVNNVKKDVQRLEELGFIETISEKRQKSQRKSTTLQINFDRIDVSISI